MSALNFWAFFIGPVWFLIDVSYFMKTTGIALRYYFTSFQSSFVLEVTSKKANGFIR